MAASPFPLPPKITSGPPRRPGQLRLLGQVWGRPGLLRWGQACSAATWALRVPGPWDRPLLLRVSARDPSNPLTSSPHPGFNENTCGRSLCSWRHRAQLTDDRGRSRRHHHNRCSWRPTHTGNRKEKKRKKGGKRGKIFSFCKNSGVTPFPAPPTRAALCRRPTARPLPPCTCGLYLLATGLHSPLPLLLPPIAPKLTSFSRTLIFVLFFYFF